MVVFAGFPLIYLEMSIGQYASLGVVSIWRAAPLFQGMFHFVQLPFGEYNVAQYRTVSTLVFDSMQVWP